MTARDEMSEMLPCPWCGDSDPIILPHFGGPDWAVRCGGCDLELPATYETEKLAERAWNTRPSPARDEGAGTMGRGEEVREMLSWLDMSIERLRGRQDLTEANLRNKYLRLRALLVAPVSAPGMDREAVARIIRGWDLPPENARIGPGTRRAIDEANAKADQIIAGQKVTSPADGSQVEPSTTGAGRHIPLEPNPFIQWNGGENPAPGKRVDVKFRVGECEMDGEAAGYDWGHPRSMGGDPKWDIIAYRIIPHSEGEEG